MQFLSVEVDRAVTFFARLTRLSWPHACILSTEEDGCSGQKRSEADSCSASISGQYARKSAVQHCRQLVSKAFKMRASGTKCCRV